MDFGQILAFCAEEAFNFKGGNLELAKIVTNDCKFFLDTDGMKGLQ